MRNATAYGASPRQRFDLVLNNLCGFAHTLGEIRMTSDGMPWRPITHIEDICQAMLCALTADREAVAGEAFNVGADSENYRIREIAEIVARTSLRRTPSSSARSWSESRSPSVWAMVNRFITWIAKTSRRSEKSGYFCVWFMVLPLFSRVCKS